MDFIIITALVAGLLLLSVFYFRQNNGSIPSRGLYRAFWFETAAAFARIAGRGSSRALAKGLGWLYGCFHPVTKKVVHQNLSLLHPAPNSRNGAEKLFVNYGAALADYFYLGVRSHTQRLGLIRERAGLENLQKAYDAGKGALLVTPHLALFELGGVIMTDLGYPMTALTRPEPTRALTQWRADYRKRWGVDTLEVGNGDFAMVEAIQQLRQGRFLALLVDRPHSENYVMVDFPNGQIPFSSGFVLLALMAECPIIPVTVVALGSEGYRLEAHPQVQPQWLPGGRKETLDHFTREAVQVLKPIICQNPYQWYQFVPIASQARERE